MKFGQQIDKRRKYRTNPKIYEDSYITRKNNLKVFSQFKDLVIKEQRSRILDVGCGVKPWIRLFEGFNVEYIGVDVNSMKSLPDCIAAGEKLPFADNSFDALIYSEVIGDIFNLEDALKEMRRIAKNQAVVFISENFIFPEHDRPYDYYRLTRYYYQKAFGEDEILLLKESNSTLSSPIILLNLSLSYTPFGRLRFLNYAIFTFNNMLAIIIDGLTRLMSKIINRWRFYLMPISYALILRINK